MTVRSTPRLSTPRPYRRRTVLVVVTLVVGGIVSGLIGPLPAAWATTCPAAFEPPFTDVPLDHPFCREILSASSEGIVEGYPDGTFRPSNEVTRQAAAAMLWRAANIDSGEVLQPCVAPPFTDVPVDHPFCAEIRDAAAAGVFEGYPDGTFRPGNDMTRQAVAATIARFPFGPSPYPDCDVAPFTDVPVDHPFCEEIAYLVDFEVVDGFPDGTFRPSNDITRQGFVAILMQWLEVYPH